MELATVCNHPRLTPAANCRFCLVEIVGDERLRPACKTIIQDGMKILTSSEKVSKAQIQLLKFVVVNHPNIKCVKCSEDVECGLKTECTAMSK
jgi:NADH-quinone oxidoreductase subunit G